MVGRGGGNASHIRVLPVLTCKFIQAVNGHVLSEGGGNCLWEATLRHYVCKPVSLVNDSYGSLLGFFEGQSALLC